MATLHYLELFIKKQDVSSLNDTEKTELNRLILNAVEEESSTPRHSATCRLELGIPEYAPAPKVLHILEANMIQFVQGQFHSYLEWRNGLLTQESK